MKRLYNHRERVNGMISMSLTRAVNTGNSRQTLDEGQLSENMLNKVSNEVEWINGRPKSVSYFADNKQITLINLSKLVKVSPGTITTISKTAQSFTMSDIDITITKSLKRDHKCNLVDHSGIILENVLVSEIAQYLEITTDHVNAIKSKRAIYQHKYKVISVKEKV